MVGRIKASQGYAPTFPIVADPDRQVANLYGMMHPAHDEVYTVRTVFVIDPKKKIRLTIVSDAEAKEKFQPAGDPSRPT